MAGTLPNGIRYGFLNSGFFVVLDDAREIAHCCHPDSMRAQEACRDPETVAGDIADDFKTWAEGGHISPHLRKRYHSLNGAELI